MPKAGTSVKCRNEQRFGSGSGGFGAQIRFERRSISGFTREDLGAILVSSRPFAGFYDRDEEAVLHFQGSGKMPRDGRRPWDNSRTENSGEHLVPAREATVTQASNEFSTAKAERACAVQNQSPDGVRVLVISR